MLPQSADDVIVVYHINCSVIQGFPIYFPISGLFLRKAVTTHVEKYDIFLFLYSQSAADTFSPLVPLGQVDE